MRSLECIVFNVDHGFCSLIKSPNDYCLMVDCGGKEFFSPIKWIRKNYNTNINYFRRRRIAQLILSHLHLDHFRDVGSFELRPKPPRDRPKILTRDKETLKFIDEKIEEEKDKTRRKILKRFKDFESQYTEDPSKIAWGFDFFDYGQLPYDAVEAISSDREKIINNRSYIIGIEYAGRKIIIPGDIEVEGWEKALEDKNLTNIIKGVNFFVSSHHGHKNGFTSEILDYSGKPDIYLVSAKSGDQEVDSSYSNSENSKGLLVKGQGKRHMISTKESNKSIKITIWEDGDSEVEFIETEDNLSPNQRKLIRRRSKKYLHKFGQ